MSEAWRWGSRIGRRLHTAEVETQQVFVYVGGITYFCVDGEKPCYRIGGRWYGSWCDVYWARLISVLLKRTKASETRRTQTKLYLEIILSSYLCTSRRTQHTFALRKPNGKREVVVSTKSFQNADPIRRRPMSSIPVHPTSSRRTTLKRILTRYSLHRCNESTHHFGLPSLGLEARPFRCSMC